MIKVEVATGMGMVVGQPRLGQRAYGVPEGGAMNSLSMNRMNCALGNERNAAGLELTGRFVFLVQSPCQVMLGPASARALLNGKAVQPGRALNLNASDVIEVLPSYQGLWCQMAFSGGLEVPELLGSRGYCIAGGFGGHKDGLLAAGDELKTCPVNQRSRVPAVVLPANEAGVVPVKAVAGPEFDAIVNERPLTDWTMSAHSSRMGYRFESRNSLKHSISLRSSYACTPGGQAVVLMADAQVSGGYPRLGSVLTSELWKVSLLAPGQSVRFEWVSFSNACQYNQKAERDFLKFEQAVLSQQD